MKISIRSSIGSKIIGGYLILVAILLLVGGISYNQLRTIESLVSNQVMETADARNLSKNIILESTYVSSLVNEYFLTTEKAQKVALRIVIKDTNQTIQEYMRQVSKRELSAKGRKILEKSQGVSLQCCEKIKAVLQSYDREGGLHGRTKKLSDEFLDLHSRLTTLLLQFDKIEEELMYGSWDYAKHNIYTVKRYIMAFSIIAIVVGLLLGIVIALSITRPVSKLADALEKYGRGDFDIRADVKGTDEIGFFAKKFNSMLEQINTSANELKRANLEMTERNLELDESRSRLQTLTDSTPDAVFLVDSDRKILDANKTFTRIFDYSSDETLTLKIDDLCSEDTVKNKLWKNIDTALKGEHVDFEFTGRKKTGKEFPVIMRLRNVLLGSKTFVLSIATDITDRKQWERALRKSEKKYRSLFDTLQDAINREDYSLTIAPESDKDDLAISLNKMLKTLETSDMEVKTRHWLKTGQTELNARMRGEQDIPSLSQNIITYLADHINAKVGAIYLADEEDTLKRTGAYAYTKNLSNEFKFGEGLIGQAALEGKEILIKNVPDDYITISSGLGKGGPLNILVMPFLYEGKTKGVIELGSFDEFTDIQLSFLRSVTDHIAITFNTAQSRSRMEDLLAKTQAQSQELQARQIELEKVQLIIEEQMREIETASKYKSEFLANMSHELRTPLNSLLILSNLLAENKSGNLSEKEMEFAKTINSAGGDLLNLINEVLDLSKIEAGKMELSIEDIYLADFAGNIERDFRHLAEEKGLKLDINLGDRLPDFISSDRQRVEQIIRNLFSNAFKFTEEGGVSFSIHRPEADIDLFASGLNPQKAVAFAVSDTGKGIAGDKLKSIFEAFQQENGTTSRRYGGTGLGLSISTELSKVLQGEMQLQSEEDKGSTFTLYLPEEFATDKKDEGSKKISLLKAKITAEEKKQEATAEEYKPHGLEVIRDDRRDITPDDRSILTIEDDPKFAKILFDLAHERGFKCLVVGNGKTGLHFADYYKPSAIILDIDLPGIDGWKVMERLKEDSNTRHIPVYFMSVFDKASDAMKMGAIGYLVKPVSMEELEEAFKEIEDMISKGIKRLPVVENDKDMILKGKKILLVDDDMRNVFALMNIFEEKGMKVITGKNGREGLNKLKDNPDTDLVLMDIMMPEMDGYEAMKEIRGKKKFEKLPIIALTAKAMMGDRDKCMLAGASDYLAKPVDIDKLLSLIRVWLYDK